MNFQIYKLVLEMAEEPEIKLPTSAESSKKQENSRKTSISTLLTTIGIISTWISIVKLEWMWKKKENNQINLVLDEK